MSVYRPKNSPYYHYDFQIRGARFHGSTEETDRRRAEAVEKAERARCQKLATAKSRKFGMTLNQAAGRYWEEVGQHRISSGKLEREVERVVEIVGKDTLIADIDDEMLARLVAERRSVPNEKTGKPVTAATVNRQLTAALRPILLRARKFWKIPLPDEPNWSAHMLPEPKQRVRELRADEELRIEAIERDEYRPVRLFAQMTGLRLREVSGLTWDQIDFDAMEIKVVGKGDRPHVVPLTTQLAEILQAARDLHPEAVFTFIAKQTRTNPRNGQTYIAGERYPVTYWGLTSQSRRDVKRAKVEDFRFHDYRHTAATRIMRKSGNLKIAQELLGHSDIRTTSRYAHVSKDDVRAAMQGVADAKTPQEIPNKIPESPAKPRAKVEK